MFTRTASIPSRKCNNGSGKRTKNQVNTLMNLFPSWMMQWRLCVMALKVGARSRNGWSDLFRDITKMIPRQYAQHQRTFLFIGMIFIGGSLSNTYPPGRLIVRLPPMVLASLPFNKYICEALCAFVRAFYFWCIHTPPRLKNAGTR